MSHQRGGTAANKRINDFLLSEYRQPKDFRSFTYMSQLLQADAMKMAMEAHRRDMPYCMGSLVWQHNDCWPVASWSSRDYYGRWKAQHYFTVKSFADLLVSPIEKDNTLQIYMVSDRLKSTSGKLTVCVLRLDGNGVVKEFKKQITVPANTSTVIWKEAVDGLLNGEKKKTSSYTFFMRIRQEKSILIITFWRSKKICVMRQLGLIKTLYRLKEGMR